MRRCLVLLSLALAVAACGPLGGRPSPTVLGCEITVTSAPDGRSGTAGCGPAVSPTPLQIPQPAKGEEHKGKGRGRD